ncbi:hypothetical protein AOLI_G00044450 [Acnodon oligacanthus]
MGSDMAQNCGSKRSNAITEPSRSSSARKKGALSGRGCSHRRPTLHHTWSDRCRTGRYLKGKVVEKQKLLHRYLNPHPVLRGRPSLTDRVAWDAVS